MEPNGKMVQNYLLGIFALKEILNNSEVYLSGRGLSAVFPLSTECFHENL